MPQPGPRPARAHRGVSVPAARRRQELGDQTDGPYFVLHGGHALVPDGGNPVGGTAVLLGALLRRHPVDLEFSVLQVWEQKVGLLLRV